MLDLFSRDRLTARFEAGPWVAKPQLPDGESQQSYDENNDVGSAVKFLGNTLSSKNPDGKWYELAKLTIKNESKKDITGIRIRYSGVEMPELLVVPEKTDNSYYIKSTNDVSLPDMKPGDTAIVYQWDNFSSILVEDSIDTYSSEGDFRINYEFPQTVSTNFAGWFISGIIDHIWLIINALSITIFILLMIQKDTIDLYYKKLLRDDDFYIDERVRYESDKDKFSPQLNDLADP